MHTKIDLQQTPVGSRTEQIAQSEWDSIIVSSWFTAEDLASPTPGECPLSEPTTELISACAEALTIGGLLFIYGAPHRLPEYSALLDRLGGDDWKLEFKYWIGVQLHVDPNRHRMRASHTGILLYQKTSTTGVTAFNIDNSIRIPYSHCTACGKNTRDWGGKTHLLNPEGSAPSDVWTDLKPRPLAGNRMPGDLFQRVSALAAGAGERIAHVIEPQPIDLVRSERTLVVSQVETEQKELLEPTALPLDSVIEADCVSFMEGLLPEHENNAFDLIFADPPYNLDKMYKNYRDAHAAEQYLEWCDRWLTLCARLLKPGGSLFVVNLPKWSLHHARTLDRTLNFKHWIVWQALAEPRGKLLPAHYSLLYYVKPGERPVMNYSDSAGGRVLGPIDSPEYCLRDTCLRKRKGNGDDKKVPLTDVWWDIFRIRHKRDRDYHPCQLPERLLERILMLSSHPGQVVFDPLGGVGTTAVVAKRLGRHYISTDIDPAYVNITRTKLAQMELNMLQSGECVVPRESIRRETRTVTKKHIESVVQQLALDLGRMPEMEDVQKADPQLYDNIHKIYDNPRKALSAARIVLDAGSGSPEDR